MFSNQYRHTHTHTDMYGIIITWRNISMGGCNPYTTHTSTSHTYTYIHTERGIERYASVLSSLGAIFLLLFVYFYYYSTTIRSLRSHQPPQCMY